MPSIVSLLILAAIVFVVLRGAGRADARSADAVTRGLFVYAALLAALLTGAIGLSGVVAGLVDPPAAGRAVGAGQLASAVVGVPVFVALARASVRRARSDASETRSQGWSLYLNLALWISLGVIVSFTFGIVTEAIDGSVASRDIAWLAIWSAVWGSHWWAWRTFGDGRRPDAYWIVASTFGLVTMVTTLVLLGAEAIQRIIERLSPSIVAGGGAIAEPFVMLVLGSAVWGWHWLWLGRVRTTGDAWAGYVLLVGVFGGLAALYIGSVGSLVAVLVWFLGDPGSDSAARFFSDVAGFLPLAIVGAAVWWYHRTVLGPRRDDQRTEIDRLYDYLVAGIAALVTTAAFATLLVVLFSLVAPASATRGDAATSNIALTAVALLLTGGPTWYLRWREIQGRQGLPAEALSTVRRVYIFTMLGIGGTAAFVSAIATLTVVFGELTGERSGSVMGTLRYPLAILLGAGTLAGYHLWVFRNEREAPGRPRRRQLVVVAGVDDDLGALEAMPGVSVTRMTTTDTTVTAPDADAVAAALEASDAARALVIARNGHIDVITLS